MPGTVGLAHFRAAAHALCRQAAAGAVIFGLGASSLPAMADAPSDMTLKTLLAPENVNARPAMPLSMAGYRERPEYDGLEIQTRYAQALYLRDRAGLQTMLRDCRANPLACHPHIRMFADMLDRAARLPDPMTQIHAVAGWLNLFGDYDDAEVAALSGPRGIGAYRTMPQALIDRKWVCHEQARLALFAFEALGFAPENVRYVLEAVYENGKLSSYHAVVLVRAGDRSFVVGNQQYRPDSKPGHASAPPRLSQDAAIALIEKNAAVESDAAQLNLSRHSFFWSHDEALIPEQSFNAHIRATYDVVAAPTLSRSSLSAQAVRAPYRIELLHYSDKRDDPAYAPLAAIMEPVLALRYRVDWKRGGSNGKVIMAGVMADLSTDEAVSPPPDPRPPSPHSLHRSRPQIHPFRR